MHSEQLYKVTEFIQKFIRFKVNDAKKTGVVVGLSGGLDSAVVAKLSELALGKQFVHALIMPDRITPIDDCDDAISFAKKLEIHYKQIDIDEITSAFIESLPEPNQAKDEKNIGNIKARIRMTLLYDYAAENNLLVIGTSDKSEWMLGYFTKHGDGAADIQPIIDLYKTEVRQLAKYIGVPENIIDKPSSPSLIEGQTAEGELGISYDDIDHILLLIDSLGSIVNNETAFKLIQYIKQTMPEFHVEKITRVFNLIINSQHKRIMPSAAAPIVKAFLSKGQYDL